ncbi:MAG: acetyl-CoA carboxylase, carboxyltransferase subunit beta [Actinomycetota bacterium]|jgi:acetyl-CoA carboxylase carboxyl transferase subunit beta|nr:acetyl-CoA carboxylase, carboxyltransferase subunit beta [Actinomycetota bacterium]
MPIADWFKARDERRYTSIGGGSAQTDVPEGVWSKCDACKRTIYEGELVAANRVCPHCGHHFPLTAMQRIDLMADEGTFVEFDAGLTSVDPLQFCAVKPYADSLDAAQDKTGLNEAIITGRATIGGHDVVIAAMDFRFIGASMGSAVGEKVTRTLEAARAEKRAAVIVTASGGARMQEGILSLMQMAKTSSAVARLGSAGLPYISVLTDPTMGGVTASFAVLADVVFAEPAARIGFAGPLIIEQTIRQKLPRGFQSAESMLQHGMLDGVVPRDELASRVSLVLDYLALASQSGDAS